ncbi:cytochrome c oxidase subunit I [Ramlibacter sp. AW1]|uniref:cytochrome-c oxidase n=1 Tax=Ramlibacter aurantiacus TaxID=2801330 RepID=A0A937D3H0_9BURK|nr:cytochrome c oxidase subunit I [Ramlibacter aurantiacus]MBL0419332.1 cytochrome c oxidase subunit I [Ramlibacter aurantiacus]
MTGPDPRERPPRDPVRLHEEFEAVWGNPTGWRALSVVNHTIVMRRFMITGGVFFVIAGLLSMLMRSQLARPSHGFMGAEAYSQAFTMHGTMMMFLFAVPVLQGLAGYLLPKMLGARDLVFPRLSAFGYWCYLFGGIILCFSLLLGLAPDAGWFMYTPLSSSVYSPGVHSDFWLLGVTFVEISTMAAAIDLVVSILRTRAHGMGLQHLPIFAWSILVSSMMIIVGFPPLILASILLELERAAGWAFFDPTRGGDPLLWQHLFWLFGHPEVYIIFLPAAGIVSTLVPVFAGRPLVGYSWVVVSLIAVGFLSFGLWVHHMFAVGIPALAQSFFAVASMLVAIPTGIQVFAWLATLWSGRPVWSLPMLWIGGFVAIFVLGGLTGVMVAFVPFDWQVHDTHFVVAHLHYVLVGGMVFPLIAGLYYWMPLFSARLPSQRLGHVGFWLTFIGFNGTFLVMHWTGLLGMPRRAYTYPTGLGWDLPNLVSSVFGFVMAFGLAAVLLDWVLHFRWGRRAPENPWRADTLEWASGMPPRSYNFASLPSLPTRHPLWDHPDLPRSIEQGRHELPQATHGRRETLGCDPVTGEPREVMVLPGNSWLPLLAGLLLAGLCISLLAKAYPVALGLTALVVLVLLRWSWENGAYSREAAAVADELPEGLRLHTRTQDGPGLWGMGMTLLADAALYASLVFAWLYLWTAAPDWRPPARSPIGTWPLAWAAGSLALGAAVMGRAVRRLRQGHVAGLRGGLLLASGLGLAGCIVLGWLLLQAPLQPRASAHDAVLAFTLWFLLVHGALSTVTAALQAWRIHVEHVSVDAPYEPGVVLMLWIFTAAAGAVAWVAMSLLPIVIGGF